MHENNSKTPIKINIFPYLQLFCLLKISFFKNVMCLALPFTEMFTKPQLPVAAVTLHGSNALLSTCSKQLISKLNSSPNPVTYIFHLQLALH